MNTPKAHPIARSPVRVAEYVRMSSDLQKYSTQNQSAAISAYAATHSMTVIRSCRDDGKSVRTCPHVVRILSASCPTEWMRWQ
jgi:hypothetical protein